jgi:hypothetical protein
MRQLLTSGDNIDIQQTLVRVIFLLTMKMVRQMQTQRMLLLMPRMPRMLPLWRKITSMIFVKPLNCVIALQKLCGLSIDGLLWNGA